MIHTLSPYLIANVVDVHVVGAGGNGSLMLSGLARLDRALRGLGHHGFKVTAWDPDTVSDTNVGRQMFYPADIGQNKATILIHRINQCFGLTWSAVPTTYLPAGTRTAAPPLLITCVDSADSRAYIGQAWAGLKGGSRYWLDMGNRAADGQVILAARIEGKEGHKKPASGNLPSVLDLYPDIVTGNVPDDDAPSCSLAEALERQQLFINQAVTTEALELLWKLFRFGEIDHHGLFINLNPRSVTRLAIDADVWARFGYPARSTRPTQPKGKKK